MYSKEEMVILSIIYSEYIDGIFPKPKVDLNLLFQVFKISIVKNKSIFNFDNIQDLVFYVTKNILNKGNYEKRVAQFIEYFKNLDYEKMLEKAKVEIENSKKYKIEIITYFDFRYPNCLKTIKLSPFVIYVKGKFPINFDNSLAIIGARKVDNIGKKLAFEFGKFLSLNNWYNISGLAIGCDTYGHIGSINKTGAILAQGLTTEIFPKENINLADKILENGGFLLSELPLTTSCKQHFFILRDRLQAALTRGVIVIETGENSGTLHTVKFALKENRKVFVLDINGEENEFIIGNIKLLNKNLKMNGNVKISKKDREKIIGIKNPIELKKYLSNSDKFDEKILIQERLF